MIADKLPDGVKSTTFFVQKPGTKEFYKYPVTITTKGDFHFLEGGFHLKDEFKCMKGAKWMGYDDPPLKQWRVANCRRNNFNIAYLEGKNPFARYQAPLKLEFALPPIRVDWYGKEIKPYAHQDEMTIHVLVRRQCIISGEMGTGKTLAIIRAMEAAKVSEVWYVAPKSALSSVKLECLKWKCFAKIRFLTYDELKRVLENWVPGTPPPQFLVGDESSRLKTIGAQRTQAFNYLAERMRDHWGDDAYIVEMSGSPAPKSPLDWYSQCEIACPGYLKEGDIYKYQKRLAVTNDNADGTGVRFTKVLAWRDGNPNKCKTCGQNRDHLNHAEHAFAPMDNEVETLYRRMKGLVLVKFKKDCLDLPEKQYKIIRLKPSLDLLRAARLVTTAAQTAIQSMTLLRELSDGFQYRDVQAKGPVCKNCVEGEINVNDVIEKCPLCSGKGFTLTTQRETVEIPSPKLDALTEIMEDHEDIGRLVVYAGFTGSIDRIVNHATKNDWQVIRVDGRGWFNTMNPNFTDIDCLKLFQSRDERKILFVGHPGSAGMGITLTASPTIVYYSNDFNAESRIQSEDRIHRPGMDANRGATIIDLVLLPTDEHVLRNLIQKRELQSISLGELRDAIDTFKYEEIKA